MITVTPLLRHAILVTVPQLQVPQLSLRTSSSQDINGHDYDHDATRCNMPMDAQLHSRAHFTFNRPAHIHPAWYLQSSTQVSIKK